MKTMIKSAAVLAVICLLVSPALANQVTLNYSNPNQYTVPNYGTTNGGEFTITALQALPGHAANTWWKSYCLEQGEWLSGSGATYNVVISDRAVTGAHDYNDQDNDGLNNPYDLLDARTAYLFTTYAPLVNTDAKADDLQNAIWWLEGEINKTYAELTGGVKDLVDLADLAVAVNGSWNGKGLGNVRVLQLTNLDGTKSQDQLIMVPAPAAFGLGLLGLGIVGWVKRRFA